jgi:hypothetical protein
VTLPVRQWLRLIAAFAAASVSPTTRGTTHGSAITIRRATVVAFPSTSAWLILTVYEPALA